MRERDQPTRLTQSGEGRPWHFYVCMLIGRVLLGHLSRTWCPSRHQSVQGIVRERRGSVGEHHRTRHELRGWRVEIVLSRAEGAVVCSRNVRCVHLVHT